MIDPTQPVTLSRADLAAAFAQVPFHELSYSPEFFYDVSGLAPNIIADPEFASACQAGYESYFDPGYRVDDDENEYYEPYTLSLDEVMQEVIVNLADIGKPFPSFLNLSPASHAFFVGFLTGWLSALRRFQPYEADYAFTYLLHCFPARS